MTTCERWWCGNAIDSSVTDLIHENYQWRTLKLRSLARIQVFASDVAVVVVVLRMNHNSGVGATHNLCAHSNTLYTESPRYLTERDIRTLSRSRARTHTRTLTSNHRDMGDVDVCGCSYGYRIEKSEWCVWALQCAQIVLWSKTHEWRQCWHNLFCVVVWVVRVCVRMYVHIQF